MKSRLLTLIRRIQYKLEEFGDRLVPRGLPYISDPNRIIGEVEMKRFKESPYPINIE